MAYNQQSPHQVPNRPSNGRVQQPYGNPQQKGTYQGRGQDTRRYRSHGEPQAGDVYGYSDTRYAQGFEEVRRPQVQQDYFGGRGNRVDAYTLPDDYARQQPHSSPARSAYRPPPINKQGHPEASDHHFDRATHFVQQDEPPRSAPVYQASSAIPVREYEDRNRYQKTVGQRPAPPQRLQSSQSEHTPHQDGRVQPSGLHGGNQQTAFNFDIYNGTHSTHDEAPRSKSAAGTYSTKSSKSKTVKSIKPLKQRILVEAPSPEIMSWDNPFPTFPMKDNKKKVAQADPESLHESVVTPSLTNDPYSGGTQDSRPQTAKSTNSIDSSLKAREFDSNNIPKNSSAQLRFPAHPKSGPKGNHSAYDKPQPMLPQDAYASTRDPQEAASFQQNARNARLDDQRIRQPERSGRSLDIERRYGNPGAVPTMPLNAAYVQEPPRSMTMPSKVSEELTQRAIQPTYSDGSPWHGNGPVPPFYSGPTDGYVPQINAEVNPDHAKQLSDGMNPSGVNAASRNFGTPKRTLGPHESFEDFFDSYYEGGNDHALIHINTDDSHNWRTPTEEEMPNFDTIPDNRPPYRRGMTVDQHLHMSPRREAPDLPELPVHYQRQDSDRSIGSSRSPGRLKQSKSSPSIRDQSSPSLRQRNGFTSPPPVPGHVPWMPPTPSSRSQRSPKYPAYDSGSYFNSTFEEQKASVDEHSSAPAERRPSGGIRTNGPRSAGQPFIGSSPHAENAPHNQQQLDHTRSRPAPQRQYNQVPPQRRTDENPSRGFQQNPQNQRQQGRPRPRENAEDRPFQQYRTPPVETQVSQADPRRPPETRPTQVSPETPISPPNRPHHLDALPHHPSPVRPGLMQGTAPPPKPTPVRQYNASVSPIQATTSSQPIPPISSMEKRTSIPVTHNELERLRQATKVNPSDRKTQLIYAKKMVEAASVLADEGGRADQKTRNKNREKYVFDAHKIVKKLVSNGYPDAMFYLADCHSRGLLGLQEDSKEAFSLYQSAAKAGHAQAAYRVAVCCEIGQEEGGGTRRDPLKAIQWYKRAAALGDAPAMYKMGMIQLKGLLGQPKNPKDAITWLKRAAERADEENPHALHELALLYESASPSDTIIRDPTYSLQLFLQAANLGYKFSQYYLGSAYEYGYLDCPISPRDSIAWYSKAAVQGEHQSELALSGWYLTGSEGTLQQSDTEAYLWARKAAQAGLAKAEFAMGYFTETGIGAPPNLEDAKRWYWRAASQNFPKARERLEELNKGGAKMQKTRVSRSAVNRQSDGECIVM